MALSFEQQTINDRIVTAASRMDGMDTHTAATHNPALKDGHLACAYSVNKVLDQAVGRTYGANTVNVESFAAAMQHGEGHRISAADARPGDIAIKDPDGREGHHGHIGIVMANGATQILSNSSSHGSFTSRQDAQAFAGRNTVEYYRIDPSTVDHAWLTAHPVAEHPLGPNGTPPPDLGHHADTRHAIHHGNPTHETPAHERSAPTAAQATTENALPGIRFGREITAAAERYHLEPRLLAAVAAQETGGPGANEGRNIVGDHGHGHGVFQIDDRWHPSFTSSPQAMDPQANANYAAHMIRGLVDRHHGDVRAALHDYNAGSAGRESTTTPWPDHRTMSYEDSVLRHRDNLDRALGAQHTHAPTPAPVSDRNANDPHIHGEMRDGRLVETPKELRTKNELIDHAVADAKLGKIDDVKFVGNGRESAKEVAQQNEKLWSAIEKNLPSNVPAAFVEPPRKDGYTQSGKILDASDGFVVQSIGRGQTTRYAQEDFHGNVPEVGKSYTVAYRGGEANAVENGRETPAQSR